MNRLRAGLWSLALCCSAALMPCHAVAQSREPEARVPLATEDSELVNQMLAWYGLIFALPDNLSLDGTLRDAATRLVQDHLARMRTVLPTWIAEERAASKNPGLRGAPLARALFLRSVNEMAISSIESAGPAHDEAWLKAAMAPDLCQTLDPRYFARRVEWIQAAPTDLRPALLAGEKELLARWGTRRQGLAPRPSAADLGAAEKAILRLRAGESVAALPMTPFLAGQVFDTHWQAGHPDRWERCARSQWWLQTQLADGRTDPRQALALFRYATMLQADDFIPRGDAAASAAAPRSVGGAAYPRDAAYFSVEGNVTLDVDTDDQGGEVRATVATRELHVPAVLDNRPVAFETMLDDPALGLAKAHRFPPGKAGSTRFVTVWKLEGGR